MNGSSRKLRAKLAKVVMYGLIAIFPRGFVAAVRETDLRQTWPFTEGLLRWRTQCRGDQPGILPPLDSAIPFKHTVSSIRDHLSDTLILRPREQLLDRFIAAAVKESSTEFYKTKDNLYASSSSTATADAARKEELAEEEIIQTRLKEHDHNTSQEVVEAAVEASSASELERKLDQSSVELVQALRRPPSSSSVVTAAAVCGEILAAGPDQPLSASAMRLRAHGGGAGTVPPPPPPPPPPVVETVLELPRKQAQTIQQRDSRATRHDLQENGSDRLLPSNVDSAMVSSRGNVGSAGIDERASRLSADKLQSEHQGCDAGSARSQRFVEGTMTTSSASDRRIEAAETVDDVFAARSERSSQVESEARVQWVSGSKRRRQEEVEEVAVGLMRSVSVDPDDDEEEDSASLEVEESGKLSAAGLEVQQAAAEIVMSKHSGSAASAQGKNLADTAGPSLVQSPAAVQPAAVRSCVVAIESSRSQSKTTSSSQVLETPMRSSPGLVVAVNPPAPGFIAGGGGGGEERVCPVCRVFASPSYTALNVHIDQCLEQDAPAANSMDRLQNRTQTLQQQQQGSRQQKFKVKTQKKRSMADLCAFAPRRDLQEDSGKSGSGSRESSPAAADSPEIAGPAARRQQHPEIRRQPRTAFVRGAGPEPPAAAATAPKKVRSYGTAPMTAAVAGRFAGPTTAGAGTHPQGGGILLQQHRAAKKQRLSTTTSDSAANSNFPQLKRPICAVDQEQQQWNSSDLHTKHKRRKLLSGKHATTVRVNSSSSPTVSTGVKKTSPSSVVRTFFFFFTFPQPPSLSLSNLAFHLSPSLSCHNNNNTKQQQYSDAAWFCHGVKERDCCYRSNKHHRQLWCRLWNLEAADISLPLSLPLSLSLSLTLSLSFSLAYTTS